MGTGCFYRELPSQAGRENSAFLYLPGNVSDGKKGIYSRAENRRLNKECREDPYGRAVLLEIYPVDTRTQINNYSDAMAAAWDYGELITAGLLFGLAAGLFFHEAAHAAAGIAYGAHVCEFGLMLYLLLPGAYVIMDEKNVKSTVKRIQIYAAGVEANFVLTGICLLLAVAVPSLFWMFSQAALCNGFLAVFNLSVMGGLDGMKIFSEVMGNRDLLGTVLDVLIPDSEHSQGSVRGINGCALKAASVAVLLFHLAFVCSIITNIAVFLIE